jgi:hypothetical protein
MPAPASQAHYGESPLLAVPPTNMSTMYDFFIDPDNNKHTLMDASADFTKQDHLDRITFMLCEVVSALNRAAR